MTARSGSHPFLFYGRQPGDFVSGGEAQWWLLRFVDAVPEAARAGIGEALANAFLGSGVELRGWAWSREPWALLMADGVGDGDRDLFGVVADGLLAVHRVAALAEVVTGSATDVGVHPWDEWSRAQRPLPSVCPGIDLPRYDVVARGDDDYERACDGTPWPIVEGNGAVLEGFAAVRGELEKKARQAAAKEAKARGKPSLEPTEPPELDVSQWPPAYAAMIPSLLEARPDLAEKPASLKYALASAVADTLLEGRNKGSGLTGGGRLVAAIPTRAPWWLAWFDPGGEVREVPVPTRDMPWGRPELSSDGERVLYPSKQVRGIVEVTLADGRARTIWSYDGSSPTRLEVGPYKHVLWEAWFLGDDRVAFVYDTFLALLQRRRDPEAPWQEVSVLPGLNQTGGECVLGRHVLMRKKQTRTVYSLVGDHFVKRGTLRYGEYASLLEQGGRVYVQEADGFSVIEGL